MKIYLISQDTNPGYDTYDSAVVCAENEQQAQKIHPKGGEYELGKCKKKWNNQTAEGSVWVAC